MDYHKGDFSIQMSLLGNDAPREIEISLSNLNPASRSAINIFLGSVCITVQLLKI